MFPIFCFYIFFVVLRISSYALRMMTILIDMADTNHRDFDELILERRAYRVTHRQGAEQQVTPVSYVYWLHFAVRPKDNRRKIGFILK